MPLPDGRDNGRPVRLGVSAAGHFDVWEFLWEHGNSPGSFARQQMRDCEDQGNPKRCLGEGMSLARSFAPVEDADAVVLILGSMPGKASLAAGRYYAHPRNSFWPIMGELFGAGPGLSYAERLQVLKSSGIALWDVIASCARQSSLDSRIEPASVVPNDFESFFRSHPAIRRVFFNGAKAEQCFRRQVRPSLTRQALQYTRLPSTSPAHAGMSYAEKLNAWRVIRRRCRSTFADPDREKP